MDHRPRFVIDKPRMAAVRSPADITVVIPSYNHEAFIAEALPSVLAQTDGAFLIMVVDDASPDATAEQALSVQDPRITVRVNPQNVGLGNSIVSVLDAINTPLTALLNSDDLFHPERLARCRESLLNSPEKQVVATDYSLVDTDGGCLALDNVSLSRDGSSICNAVRSLQEERSKDHGQITIFHHLLEHNFLATSSNIVCRTEYLRRRAETLKGLNYCLDWQLFLDASLDERLTYLRENLLGYRLHSGNTIWFTNADRSDYYLEANRVAARALQRFLFSLADPQRKGPELERVLRTVLEQLAANGIVDGFGLGLSTLFQSEEFEQAGQRNELMKTLYAMAQETPFKRKDWNGSWVIQTARIIMYLWKKSLHRVPA